MKFLSNLFGGSKEDKALRFCRKKSSERKSGLSMAHIAISKISEQIQIKNSLILWLTVLTCFLAVPAWADNYEVNLTRKSANVYKVDGKDIIIQTRYCYVYSYSEEAIFKTSGYGGEIIFFDSKDKCDVKAVFGVSTQKPGKYVVTVSHEDGLVIQLLDRLVNGASTLKNRQIHLTVRTLLKGGLAILDTNRSVANA